MGGFIRAPFAVSRTERGFFARGRALFRAPGLDSPASRVLSMAKTYAFGWATTAPDPETRRYRPETRRYRP